MAAASAAESVTSLITRSHTGAGARVIIMISVDIVMSSQQQQLLSGLTSFCVCLDVIRDIESVS